MAAHKLNNKLSLKFDKICRACLEVKKEMRPLFEQLTATMLMDISKVKVAVGDGLPAQLCLQCVHQISRCHAFRDIVERNDTTLRQQVKAMAELQAAKETQEKEMAANIEPTQFMQYIEVPLTTTPEGMLEGFFSNSEQTPAEGTPTVVVVQPDSKEEFVKTQEQVKPAQSDSGKDEETLNSDEENYLQMVVFQATSSVAPGRHVCNLCHKEFKNARWLKHHMRSHTNWIKANCKKPPMCPICDRTFKGPGMLKMHMQTHEQRPAKQPTCSVCQRTFLTKTLLYRHRQTHFEQKTHQCTVCEKRFYSNYALRSHMARHRGERPYICSMCSKSFYNPTDLKVHFRLHTGEKPLKCSECHKTFRRHSTLCQHMKKHKGIRNHVCSVCNKAFYEVSKLNAHMRVHTGERPFECQYCERKFAQQSALIYHRRTHTGEKPYSCKLCLAKFTTSSARNNHMVTHTGNKKFVCPICLKACLSRSELRVHSSKHSGEKLFGCSLCSQRFSSASYLAVHRRHHTGERNYHCNVCGKSYIESGSYKKHMKTHEVKHERAESSGQAEAGVSSRDNKAESDLQSDPGSAAPGEHSEMQIIQIQEDPDVISSNEPGSAPVQKRYKCGLCVKTYMYLHSLKKHMMAHVQVQQQPSQQQQQQQQQIQQQQHQHQQQVQQQHVQQVPMQQSAVLQLNVPIQQQQIVQGGQTYPVISSVQSLQLQQSQQHVSQHVSQPLHVQTIHALHPQHQPIQIHAVGVQQVQQVQQQQLHVATSSCQTMLPANILQLQSATVVAPELGGVHRILLQPSNQGHPALYTIHQ